MAVGENRLQGHAIMLKLRRSVIFGVARLHKTSFVHISMSVKLKPFLLGVQTNRASWTHRHGATYLPTLTKLRHARSVNCDQ